MKTAVIWFGAEIIERVEKFKYVRYDDDSKMNYIYNLDDKIMAIIPTTYAITFFLNIIVMKKYKSSKPEHDTQTIAFYISLCISLLALGVSIIGLIITN